MVLTGKQIIDRGIVTDLVDAKVQEQICGVDLTVQKIERFLGRGTIDFDNSRRALPSMEDVVPVNDTWELDAGAYLITYNEVVSVPDDHFGICIIRSTMLRIGATMETAVWDGGYRGRGKSLLIVYNSNGIIIERDARIAQIMFHPMIEIGTKVYSGIYNMESIDLMK